jgi:hypothetical protein
LLSVQLSGIKNGVGGKSKDYFFEKENDDYKNFLSRCKDLQNIEEEHEGENCDSGSLSS